MKITASRTLAIALLMAFVLPALAQDAFTGKVVGVIDGDTLQVLRDGVEVKVRLIGVDAPEIGQAFGSQARQFISDLTLNKTVRIESKGADKAGRMLGEVTLIPAADDTTPPKNLNQEMIRAGLAWWYHQGAAQDTSLAEAETKARAGRIGLWKDDAPVPPWAFQAAAIAPAQTGATTGKTKPARTVRETGTGAAATPVPPKKTTTREELPPATDNATIVYASKSGTKYHRANCRMLRAAPTEITLAEARAKALEPCKVCNP